MTTPTTGSQTIGPYWHLLEEKEWADLTRFGATGEIITLTGTIRDGDNALVTDACVEIWQTSPAKSDTFEGWGRARTDAEGRFTFKTLKPGPVAGRGNALQAPHIAITILARGILIAIHTRAYFEGEPQNELDPLLTMIEDPARRNTLISKSTAPGVWNLDIRLQGDNETVFLEI